MPRKRRVGEMLLRQKAVKILRPRRIRSETGTDHPSNERTSHPPLQNSLLRSPLRPQRPFQASLPTGTLYRPAIHVKQKKRTNPRRMKSWRMPDAGLVDLLAIPMRRWSLQARSCPPARPPTAGPHPTSLNSMTFLPSRDAPVLRHQSFCFSSFSECATAGLVRPWVGALLYLDTPRAGGRMGVADATASVQQERGAGKR